MRTIQVIEKNGKLYFHRLTLNQRIQHVLLFVSFTLLAATGLPLKFHSTWWGPKVYALVGGIHYAPILHRVSAVVMTFAFLYHVIYVLVCCYRYYIVPLREEGKLSLGTALIAITEMPMVPNLTDIKELFRVLKYFLFITNERPSLVFHGLKEKFGYLAVFWGVPVIGISGYFLWYKEYFTQFFSGNVLNFAYIAHSDEAFLASIVIFIWHLYNVHLAPAVFPMGAAWLNGSIDEREMVEYHYEDYVRAMKDAGLKDRIRPNALEISYKTGFLSRAVEKLFMAVFIVAIIGATVSISRVIYNSAFIMGYQIVTTDQKHEVEVQAEPKFFEEVVLEAAEGKQMYRGYRFIEEKKIKKHYHRIELKVGPDNASPCIKCHGDLPHGKSEELRAFLNMHNLYFGCRTCHVRPAEGKKALTYFWYKRSTGEVVPNPQVGDAPIDSLDIKLTPCDNCDKAPDIKEIEKERAEFSALLQGLEEKGLSKEQKKKILEQIHKGTSKQPVVCNECHNKKSQFIPLIEVGYPKERVAMVASDEITKMINEYEVFHKPKFIEPDKWTVK
jgi:cytochrome b subunit of formate dehydrogenase